MTPSPTRGEPAESLPTKFFSGFGRAAKRARNNETNFTYAHENVYIGGCRMISSVYSCYRRASVGGRRGGEKGG